MRKSGELSWVPCVTLPLSELLALVMFLSMNKVKYVCAADKGYVHQKLSVFNNTY